MKLVLFILIALMILAVGVIVVDSNRFVVREYTIESHKLSRDHEFLFLSDLHCKSYGKNNSKLLKAIDEIHAEAIFLGGDMVTAHAGKETDTPAFFVRELCKRLPVFYSEGNHEARLKWYPEDYGDMYDKYIEKLDKIPVKILDNEKVGFEDIDIYALSIERKYYIRRIKANYKDDHTEKLVGPNDESRFSILMAHDPEYFEAYAKWKPDLVLSGHNHGGIANLPFVGGVISPRLKLFPHYDGGLFEEFGSKMILSRGIGSHTIPSRFFNPGELIVIHLKKH